MSNYNVHEKRRVFDDVFQIDEAVVEYRRHDGSWSGPVRRLVFERGDSVAALLRNPATGKLLLVNQFRYPTCEKGPGWLTEIVAGGLGPEESPEEAIAREIREETGYTSARLTPVTTFYVSPGGTSERIMLFYGEVDPDVEGAEEESLGTEGEDLRLVELSADQLWRDFRSGELQDAKTIVALLWYRLEGPGSSETG